MTPAERIVRHYNGTWSGSQGNIPGDGHSRGDRSVSVKDAPDKPEGILVCVRGAGDWRAEMDRFRRDGLLDPFEPRRTNGDANGHGGEDNGPLRCTGTYEYDDGAGTVIYRTRRLEKTGEKKRFVAERPEAGRWATGLGDIPRVPYRLTALRKALSAAVLAERPFPPIYFVEGERKADKLASWGFLATAIAFGAGGWRDDYTKVTSLIDAPVIILPDNDDKGREFAEKVKAGLEAVGGTVRVLNLPGLPEKGDIVDWTGTAEDLRKLTEELFNGKPETLPTLDLAALSLLRAQPKQFAIERLAPLGEVTLFTGAGSAGKSLLAQQLATAAAAGTTCLRLGVAPTPAIYATCEDDPEQLHWRQQHICEAMRLPMASLSGRLHLISLRGALDNELGRFAHDGTMTLAPGYHRLVATIRATGSSLVFLDNVAHLFTGNENDRGQVTRFINLLNRLAGETGAAIVLLGHPPKPAKPGEKTHQTSGSTAWLNAVRSQFYIDHDLTTDFRTLSVGKANYAQKGDTVRFIWQDWAFVHEDDLPADMREQMAETIQASGDNKLFLTCLVERNKQRRQVSEKPTAQNFAPKIFEGMPEAKGLSRQRLNSAMDRLFRIKAIERSLLWREDGKDIFGLCEASPDARAIPGNLAGNLPETSAENLRKPAENDREHPPYTYGISGAANGPAAPVEDEDADDFLEWAK